MTLFSKDNHTEVFITSLAFPNLWMPEPHAHRLVLMICSSRLNLTYSIEIELVHSTLTSTDHVLLHVHLFDRCDISVVASSFAHTHSHTEKRGVKFYVVQQKPVLTKKISANPTLVRTRGNTHNNRKRGVKMQSTLPVPPQPHPKPAP